MRQHPIIGRDYLPSPTLRRLPPYWRLSESTPRRWAWWAEGDFWVGAAATTVGLVAAAEFLWGLL